MPPRSPTPLLLRHAALAACLVALATVDAGHHAAASESVRILRPGQYHAGEVPADAAGNWTAICTDGAAPAFQAVRVTVEPAHDEVLDEPDQKSGVLVRAEGCGQPVLLMRGLPAVPPTAATSFVGETELKIGTVVELPWKDPGIALHVQQTAGADDGAHTIVLVAGPRRQELVSHSHCDDCRSVLLWAGDVDGDGAIDLLLDSADHYNVSELHLFVSSGAAPSMVRRAAAFRTSGC